jgi:hypothetical protein
MPKKTKRGPRAKSITVTSKSYGNALIGKKIFYEGERPKGLRDDGSFTFGKNILQLFGSKFSQFKVILTKDTDSDTKKGNTREFRISQRTLTKLNGQKIARTGDIKNDILKRHFSTEYPTYFTAGGTPVYIAGAIANLVQPGILPKLSSEDRDALNEFIPDFLASEALSAVNLLKASTQIKSLKDLAANMRAALAETKSESWWQTFIKKNIMLIQQGYIQSLEKMNVSLGETKYPDFVLITHDNFLDVLEIKQPSANLLKLDTSRGNYYWDTELSKAIIQTENYIEYISKQRDTVRVFIEDKFEIKLRVVRPRGIVLAGNASVLKLAKEKEDFRILTQSTKNITFLTYDELLNRLENYINVLEQYSGKAKPKKRIAAKKAAKKSKARKSRL